MNQQSVILDTSALITFLASEPGADKVLKLLSASRVPFICLSELYYIIWKKTDKAEADKIYGIVKNWHLPILYPNERVMLNAGRLKVVYKLGTSDSYIAAFALEENLPLLTKDKDFKVLKEEIKLLLL